jgi:hypothetical protein
MAHAPSTVKSTAMAWYLLIEVTQFLFSHDFQKSFFLSCEAIIHFRFRQIKDKDTGWID